MFFQREIKDTIVTARGPEGEMLAIVQFTDGGFGISRNGKPIAGHYFPSTQLDECIATMLTLSGLARPHQRF
jgi:hypothetical protein